MNQRYKILEVRATGHGNLPGTARILFEPWLIAELLTNEICNLGGASAFGVESPAFAWFVKGRSNYLVFREDDSDFNIDLAMTRLPNLPGQPPVDWFSMLQGRMTRDRGYLPAILNKRGFGLAADTPLPHDGMGGVLLTGPTGTTVFGAPQLPCLSGAQPSSAAQVLLDLWFRQLTDILTTLKTSHSPVEIAFEVGGTTLIPNWFREWCRENNIQILEFESFQTKK